MHNKVVFEEYNQNQLMLPIDIDSLIPANHMVRVIMRKMAAANG